jgi:hypothetical protein
MPTFTLLGEQVIRFPFIINSSYPHEILHNWWGNSVFVDYATGNWCEGLVTYLADYLYTEKASSEEGRNYRLQILRTFTALVNAGNDFPLSQFKSRYDAASQVIGYGKGAMVFHMVRRTIGDMAFWDGLRDVFRDKRFKEAAWKDFQVAFERRAGVPLDSFFEQWIVRKGVPDLRLQNPEMNKQGVSWIVTGSILQKEPSYALDLPVRLTAPSGKQDSRVPASGIETIFQISSADRPSRLEVDAECDVMRVLHPSEIPACVNSLKGSSSVLLVLPKTPFSQHLETAEILVQSLGLKVFGYISEAELKATDLTEHDLLLIGLPQNPSFFSKMPEGVTVQEKRFAVNGKTYDASSNSFFVVFRSLIHKERFLALFLSLSEKHSHEVARKITHYGGYSYLVFTEGHNETKGTWPVTNSPLVYEWEGE